MQVGVRDPAVPRPPDLLLLPLLLSQANLKEALLNVDSCGWKVTFDCFKEAELSFKRAEWSFKRAELSVRWAELSFERAELSEPGGGTRPRGAEASRPAPPPPPRPRSRRSTLHPAPYTPNARVRPVCSCTADLPLQMRNSVRVSSLNAFRYSWTIDLFCGAEASRPAPPPPPRSRSRR